jgi:hypothetical protein
MSHPTTLLVGALAASSVITSIVYGLSVSFYGSSTFSIFRSLLGSIQTYAPLALPIFFDSDTLFPFLIKCSVVFAVTGVIFQQVGAKVTGDFGQIIRSLGDQLTLNAGSFLAAAVIAKIKSRN